MSDRTCPICGKIFEWPALLKRHRTSKKICGLASAPAEKNTFQCKRCGREFTQASNLSRHANHHCKRADEALGGDKTTADLARQEVVELKSQVEELTSLVKKLGAPRLQTGDVSQLTYIENPTVQNIQNNVILISPWTSDSCISVGATDVVAAFENNKQLQEYMYMDDTARTDEKLAPPYVAELFVDLIKLGHADPSAKNVYINPCRSDQVLALMTSGRWEVLPLVNATRLLLDGVAQRLFELTRIHNALPLRECAAAAMAALMYQGRPDEYARLTKARMAAHLSNTRPQAGASIAVGAPLPAPAALYPGVRPPSLRGAPVEKRWATADAVEQLAQAPRRPGEALEDWARRLVLAAGVDDGRWCNKLWEALNENMVPVARRAEAEELLTAAEHAN